MNKKEIIF